MNISTILLDAALAFALFSRERPVLYFSMLGSMFVGCVAIRWARGLARFSIGMLFLCSTFTCLLLAWSQRQPWLLCLAAMAACPLLLWRARRRRGPGELTTQEFLMGVDPARRKPPR